MNAEEKKVEEVLLETEKACSLLEHRSEFLRCATKHDDETESDFRMRESALAQDFWLSFFALKAQLQALQDRMARPGETRI